MKLLAMASATASVLLIKLDRVGLHRVEWAYRNKPKRAGGQMNIKVYRAEDGSYIVPDTTAAERAMKEIRTAVDRYLDGTSRETATLMNINRIIGHYDYACIGEGAGSDGPVTWSK